jgi:hypothetical protein
MDCPFSSELAAPCPTIQTIAEYRYTAGPTSRDAVSSFETLLPQSERNALARKRARLVPARRPLMAYCHGWH